MSATTEAPLSRDVRSGVPRPGDAWAVALITLAILLAWWAAYFPGAFTVDSTQQFQQIADGVYQNWHPVFHTWVMGLLTRIWDSPGMVSLVQAIAFSAVLARLSRALSWAEVPRWLAVAVPILMAAVPNSGTMSFAIWKDVPFALSVLWAFAEILVLVTGSSKATSSPWTVVRLGLAVFGVLAFRANGILVGGLILLGILWVLRRWLVGALVVTALSVGGYALVQGPLYAALDAWPAPALFTYTTFVHDMGAFITNDLEDIPEEDRRYLASILPLDRWAAHDEETNPDGLYYCRQATPLIFPPELYPAERYDRSGRLVPTDSLPRVVSQNSTSNVLEADPDRFMGVWFDAVMRNPLTLLEHRFCVSGVAWSPVPVGGGRPFTVPLRIAENSLGIQSDPIAPSLRSVLDEYTAFWGRFSLVTWRPALWIYAGFAAAWIGMRRRRELAVPGSWWVVLIPGFASWVSVVLFTPGQSYRYLWPAHLCAYASLALLAGPLARRRGRHAAAQEDQVT